MGRFLGLFYFCFFTFTGFAFSSETEIKSSYLLKVFAKNGARVLWVHPEEWSLNKEGFKSHDEIVFLTTETNRPPQDSTGDIVKALRESQKSLILVCQDKSSADCLESLILYPELQIKLLAFINLNGKISGAEWAEQAKNPLASSEVEKAQVIPLAQAVRAMIDFVVSYLDGFHLGVYAMKPENRAKSLEKHRYKIADLVKRVPVISVDRTRKKYGFIPGSHFYRSWKAFSKNLCLDMRTSMSFCSSQDLKALK